MKLIILIGLIFLYGCVSPETVKFNEGVERIDDIDNEFGASMKKAPDSIEKVDGLIAGLTGFAASQEITSIKSLLGFRIKNLEAERLYIEGWQWGRGSTTEWGFGCRNGFERITNSSILRNASASKGYESVELLQKFIDEFPKEAKSINLTQLDVLFLNANYVLEQEKAEKDGRTVKSLCKKD
jgi:hypothetical protein